MNDPRHKPVAVIAAACLVAVLAPGGAGATRRSQAPPSGCFWSLPITIDLLNIGFPDTHAIYWYNTFQLPADATVSLQADYPHARYMSLNSYFTTPENKGVPSDAIHDAQIVPDPGSRNPFLPGAKRTAHPGSWTVTVNGDTPPSPGQPRAQNTLYAGTGNPGQTQPVELIYRVYVPDKNRDLAGDGRLPEPTVVLADGTQLTGQQACDALQLSTTFPSPDRMAPATYNALINLPGAQPTSPALDPPRWYAAFNRCTLQFPFFAAAGLPLPPCPPTRAVTQWANIDNAYASTAIDRRFGPSSDGHNVVVLHGKMPTTPRTYRRNPFMEGPTQLRYWSMCQNESLVTTQAVDCLYDEQVPLDDDGFYTIVVSTPEDRPANATTRCGVAWLDWGTDGDGAGRPTQGLLIMRNMLPDPSFAEAIQNVVVPGTEVQVMGEYLPAGTYMSTTEFESLGCR
jgi:hypothetical protein